MFRGFYFTSALQEGSGVEKASGRLARRFGLEAGKAEAEVVRETRNGYFLLNLFRKVIFADRRLVRRYTHRSRLRARRVAFFAAAVVLGGMFAAWSWSYTGNRQMLAEAEARTFMDAGFASRHLGPSILRLETAALLVMGLHYHARIVKPETS